MNWKVTLTRSHNTYNKELDSIYDEIAEGIRIRSKCDWYEHGEKFHKLFLNLEKKLFIKSKFVSLYLTKKIHDDVEL